MIFLLKEIRIHGRGGQGAVTSSQVLAIAAFEDGIHCQAFPSFGVERTGAPVKSFVRFSDRKVLKRQHVYLPDYVIVLDPTLMDSVDVTDGIKKNGILLINSNKTPAELGFTGKEKFKVYVLDITKDALEVIGKPFVNIAALGAFCCITCLVSIEALSKAIEIRFGEGKTAELNTKAAKKVFGECLDHKGGTCPVLKVSK